MKSFFYTFFFILLHCTVLCFLLIFLSLLLCTDAPPPPLPLTVIQFCPQEFGWWNKMPSQSHSLSSSSFAQRPEFASHLSSSHVNRWQTIATLMDCVNCIKGCSLPAMFQRFKVDTHSLARSKKKFAPLLALTRRPSIRAPRTEPISSSSSYYRRKTAGNKFSCLFCDERIKCVSLVAISSGDDRRTDEKWRSFLSEKIAMSPDVVRPLSCCAVMMMASLNICLVLHCTARRFLERKDGNGQGSKKEEEAESSRLLTSS